MLYLFVPLVGDFYSLGLPSSYLLESALISSVTSPVIANFPFSVDDVEPISINSHLPSTSQFTNYLVTFFESEMSVYILSLYGITGVSLVIKSLFVK